MDIKNYEWQSDFAKKHIAEGYRQGMAKVVLRVLDRRGVVVTDETRDRIAGCDDIEQLERWLDRAVDMDVADGLFD
ncbi:hypothetical protein GCM10009527_054970 [Actinomadura nitritigenes]|uniref:Uncharacterized protein n=1 Tax=Actinomadura nitritigenes TaxID=134602 RepID=A0ABS3R8V1_9ACTN|nr:hypothetical protein [Actinomadura nitritigenes]MBO2442647.1 hypothetical protein [Actinomadura nitritigenes]